MSAAKSLGLIDGSETKKRGGYRPRKPTVSKDEALQAIGMEIAAIRDAKGALDKMEASLSASVRGNVDMNLSMKDEARNVIESIDECREAAKRILLVVVARCSARLKE